MKLIKINKLNLIALLQIAINVINLMIKYVNIVKRTFSCLMINVF